MISVVILAAGQGQRMQLGYNKMLYRLDNKPLYLQTLEKFLDVGPCYLVLNEEDMHIEVPDGVTKILGGKERQESVYKALKEIKTPHVIIHDGARCFVSKEIINRSVRAARQSDAFFVGVKPKDTIKMGTNNLIREQLWIAQTPQGGKTALFLEAYQKADQENYQATDDVSLIEKYKLGKIDIVLGEYSNLKVTTKDDLEMMNIRIGHSFDVHQLVEGRPLILGGIKIPYEKGLLGHSDADVLYHSVAEAILGALALGDLGKLFPDNDPQYKGLNSQIIVEKAFSLMSEKGYEINNLDATIYAEKPKMAPYIDEFCLNISKLLKTSIKNISVKATTYEKLGEIGQGKAIASETVVLLKHK